MLTSLAASYLPDEPEQAVATALDALDVSVRSGYAVAFSAIDELRAQLPADLAGVDALRERLAAV
jgi:hypothetical protein